MSYQDPEKERQYQKRYQPQYQKQDVYRQYQRQYRHRLIAERRAAALVKLGGKCVDCGMTEKLEFDHVVPALKCFTIMKRGACCSEERFWDEIAKCQLRCRRCHQLKTLRNREWRATPDE